MVLVRSFAPVHLCAFVLSFLNQIYQESPSFPGESPPVKLNSAPVFPSFLLLSDICFSLSLSLSLLNELSGELSHVSTHRNRQTRQQSKAVAFMFVLSLYYMQK